jgi:hypothetical protein
MGMNSDAFDKEIIWGNGGLLWLVSVVSGGLGVGVVFASGAEVVLSSGAFSAIELSGEIMRSATVNK